MDNAFSEQQPLTVGADRSTALSTEISVRELSTSLFYIRAEVPFSTLQSVLHHDVVIHGVIAYGPIGCELLDDYQVFQETHFLTRILIEGGEIRWTPGTPPSGCLVLVSENDELLQVLLPQSTKDSHWSDWEKCDISAVAEVHHKGWRSKEYLSKTVDGNLSLVDEIVLSTPRR